MLRRRRLPDDLHETYAAFERIVPPLERAKSALASAVPWSRLPGRPLAESLLGFEEGLRTVAQGMDAWRAPEVEEAWLAASDGLARARTLAEGVRLDAPAPEGFEGLIGLVGDLLAPLEAFGAATERFEVLRR